MNRRHFVMGASALSVITIGGVSYCSAAKTPKSAYLPWSPKAPAPADVRLDAFRYAILAPNPHNRQPWLIALRGDDEALVFCDLEKRLPVTDPFDRQITIGFGTFFELAAIAAAQRGIEIEFTLFPEGTPSGRLDKRPIALLRFMQRQDVAPDSLFAHVLNRRSNKQSYDMKRPVDPAALSALSEIEHASVDQAIIAKAEAIILGAIETETRTPMAHKESVDLMRIGSAAVDAAPDGISLVGAKIETARAFGFLSAKAMLDPDSGAFEAGLKQQLETQATIPALFWISTDGNDRTHQIDAGRRYMRANLLATSFGIAMHPMSQSLQEYREMETVFKAIHALLQGDKGGRIQMLARIGYSDTNAPPTPRWPMEKHLI
jgi:hypothetical protein